VVGLKDFMGQKKEEEKKKISFYFQKIFSEKNNLEIAR
jgi:hypothetical protein